MWKHCVIGILIGLLVVFVRESLRQRRKAAIYKDAFDTIGEREMDLTIKLAALEKEA